MTSVPSFLTIRLLYIGPVFFGSLFNWALLGMLTAQLYSFYIHFPEEEHTPIKTFSASAIYFLYILDLVQTVESMHYSYYILVYGWGDLSVQYGHAEFYVMLEIFNFEELEAYHLAFRGY
ncbi:uncharacterized protein BT62DRAFT_920684 [Guyanagaster necrorhizus]|uniref:Uncharacterized protein n=1 Tax=Guyanagaster necrorhizus TaxID=856835 RepID=A0A9P7VRS5_9AGAR|nr:uncharacterized protein BT62DRAFT_920684 [Guyanagaster necrorhizus MCA 3950]KAG7445478.1 hypothetical protein BT62DRAFT_920684 [Guyanagaster necrorhizus MCA 3950]